VSQENESGGESRKPSEPTPSAQGSYRAVQGFRFYPEGAHAEGEIVAVAEPPASGRNRKIFVGRIEADGTVDILGPSQILDLKEAAELIERRYPLLKELLWLFRIIRKGLRRRRAHRDVKDDHLPMALILGHKSGSPLGESYRSARDRKRSMRDAAKRDIPADERVDDLCWDSTFEAPGSRIDFKDPQMRDFICRLYDCLGQFEDKYNARGINPDDRLPADLERLRRDGFRFIGIESADEGQRLFNRLIRDAVQVTSRIAGLTALQIIMDRVKPGPTQTETDMINLAYGTPMELAGVSRDLFGRRSATIDPLLSELYQLLAQGAPKAALDEKRKELAKLFFLSYTYHALRKEARRDTKRQARAIKRKVAEFSDNPPDSSAEENPPPVSEATAAPSGVSPLSIRDLLTISEHREKLVQVAQRVRLQRRTRQILDALLDTGWDVAETAKRLDCTERKIRDAIRHTLSPKMSQIAQELRRREEAQN
jgi:hypothetical protein